MVTALLIEAPSTGKQMVVRTGRVAVACRLTESDSLDRGMQLSAGIRLGREGRFESQPETAVQL